MSFVDRTVRVKLTPDEKASLREQNAEIDLEMQRAKEVLDEAKSQYKFITDPLKAKKAVALADLRTGFTEKNLQVAESVNIKDGIIEYMDAETGAVVDSREMTTKERLLFRQQSIPFNNN